MSFTYDNPNNSRLELIRFRVGDTAEAKAVLTDEEIEYIISEKASLNAQVAAAFRQMATIYNVKPGKRTLGPQTEDSSNRQKYFAEMADRYERNLVYAGVPPTPAYSADAVFDKNMMANEE